MPNRPGRPYANTRLVKFLEKRIGELPPRKTQIAIAAEAGFKAVNTLAMIKAGTTKLPLDRVPALAQALECDFVRLFLLAVEQTDLILARRIDENLRLVTRNEMQIVELDTRKNPTANGGFVIPLPCRDLEAGRWSSGRFSGFRSTLSN